MYTRLLNFLCCPQCHGNLKVFPLANAPAAASDPVEEISAGLLYCERAHWFPVVRGVPRMREAALALMDIFGAPDAYYHTYEEVAEWYQAAGFTEFWPCNDDRRGFGVCGRLPATKESGRQKKKSVFENKPAWSSSPAAAHGALLEAAASAQGRKV